MKNQELIQFLRNEKILDPCRDTFAKCVFGSETEQSKAVLNILLSRVFEKKKYVAFLKPNEIPSRKSNHVLTRFDINCIDCADNYIDVEFTMEPKSFEFIKNKNYLAKMLSVSMLSSFIKMLLNVQWFYSQKMGQYHT